MSNELDLSKAQDRKVLSVTLLTKIDEYAATAYNDGHRNHLGASSIGEECKRKLWYMFRWVKQPTFPGRVQRLFQRGHREEVAYIEYLRGIGCTVWDRDPHAPARPDGTQPQIRVSGVNGHYGGSCDAVIQFPAAWGTFPPMLAEFKTKATGAGFNKLGNEGVEVADPVHWAQMCVYGHKLGLKYAAYFSTNKNDDSMHIEVLELSEKVAVFMEEKAEMIITSRDAPERYSNNPTAFKCKFCDFANICHNGEHFEKNCRSCANARPAFEGKWYCSHNNGTIPDNVIKVGCNAYTPVNDGVC